MKSLNFKRKENAQLRYIEEQMTGKRSKRVNWDRIVYLTILALVVFFVLRYFYLNSFYITANGQVIFDNVNVSSTEDMRIERYYHKEGETIKKGDTLFIYSIQDSDLAELGNSSSNGGSWTDKELYSLQKSIDLNNSKIAGDRALLNSYKGQLRQLENDAILGAASDRDINNMKYQISRVETSIQLTKSETDVLRKQLKTMQSKMSEIADLETGEFADFSPFRAFVSPIDGYIANLYMEPHEVAFKSQIVLKIYQSDSVFVKGYFEQEDLKYVNVGDKVDVLFPDGSESEGIINRFYSSTVLIPEEFQKKYEPAKRTIAVDVVPAKGANLDLWKRYYKLSVKLEKRTF